MTGQAPHRLARHVALIGAAVLLAPSPAAAVQRNSRTTFPSTVPGLSTNISWGRQDTRSTDCCQSVLALQSDNTLAHSYAWPLVITLNATTSPAATQDSSQSTGVNARSYSSSTGTPWLAGIHSEVWHGWSYPTLTKTPAGGTTLAYNAEVHRATPTGRVIGMEVNGLGPFPGDAAIRVDGRWKVGIELGENSLHAATVISNTVVARRVFLAPGVWIAYQHGRVVVHRHGRIVASW